MARILALLAALLAVAAAIAFATIRLTLPANAAEQPSCGPWEEMLVYAANHYGEYPAFIAASDQGAVIIVTVNPDKGSYTVFAQPNEEIACAVDSGQGWNAASQTIIDNIRKKVGQGI